MKQLQYLSMPSVRLKSILSAMGVSLTIRKVMMMIMIVTMKWKRCQTVLSNMMMCGALI